MSPAEIAALLAVSGLAKSFTGSAPAFRDLDMTLRPGDLVVVTGSRDSGKTSVVRCLNGTYSPSAGTVVLAVDGHCADLAIAPPRTLAWIRRHHVATFDGPLVAPPSQAVATAVARAAQVPRADAQRAMERLGAGHLADVTLGRLRPAQRHSVALAATLAAPAPLLLLDEPESVADSQLLADWFDERRADGTSIVVAARADSAFREHATTVIHLDAIQLDEGRQT